MKKSLDKIPYRGYTYNMEDILKKFQESVTNTNHYKKHEMHNVFILGVIGELGELMDAVKKLDYPTNKNSVTSLEDLTLEAGDLLWYLTALCTYYGVSLETILEKNIVKLQERYKIPVSVDNTKVLVTETKTESSFIMPTTTGTIRLTETLPQSLKDIMKEPVKTCGHGFGKHSTINPANGYCKSCNKNILFLPQQEEGEKHESF